MEEGSKYRLNNKFRVYLEELLFPKLSLNGVRREWLLLNSKKLRKDKIMKKVLSLSLVIALILSGCSWSTDQLGPDTYEISGYFDFTMKGSVVVQGLEMQADAQCKTVGPDYVPEVFHISYKNRIFNYEAQRASAVIRFHCVRPETKNKL